MSAGKPEGLPKSGGRQKGVPNKANRELREIAREYTAEAVQTLAGIMRKSDSDQARALAADKILDRGHGKPSQIIAGDKENPIEVVIRGLRVELNAKLDRLSRPG